MQSRLLMTHLEKSYNLTLMVKLKQHCWIVEVLIMRVWKMERYIKARLSGNLVSAFNTTFMYPSIYFTM